MLSTILEPDLSLTREEFNAMWGSARFSPILEQNAFSFYDVDSLFRPEIQSLKVEYVGSGLMYFRARYYSGDLGRFVSRDPLGYVDGMNLYRGYFVPGGVDPSGENAGALIGGAMGGILDVGELLWDDEPDKALAGAALGAGLYAGIQACFAKKSGKESASDVPSWAEGLKPKAGESGKDFAKRVLDGKYGPGNYPKGPGTEFNKVKKRGDRGPR